MASLPDILALDGAEDYLRWKESMLLRVHTLGVGHVLFGTRPAASDVVGLQVAAKWARDDAVCRGHILAALSDRLLPDYACFATAAELWHALARTYDVVEGPPLNMLYQFYFDRSTADVFLEQLAHAKALGVAAGLRDEDVAKLLRGKLPSAARVTPGEKEFQSIWVAARWFASTGVDPWYMDNAEQAETSGKRARRRA